MLSRRSALAVGASAVLVGTAGCVDRLPFIGDSPMEFEATPASIAPSVLDETGYEEHETDEVVIEETVEAGGQSQDIIVTNWQAEFDKAIDLAGLGLSIDERHRAAVFTALTTPRISVLNRTFNPIGNMSSAELAEMVQDRYNGMGSLEAVGEETATVAGQSTRVGEFETEADLVGESVRIDLTLHIAEAVESGDDLIVGIGGYPTNSRNEERPNIFSLLEAIEHDG